jgi:hypothetical protein
MHKKDSILFGMLVGILLPLALYVLLYLILALAEMVFSVEWLNERPAVKLISIAINLLLIRYYFVSLKYEKTGRGLLIITFAYIIAYFLTYPPA